MLAHTREQDAEMKALNEIKATLGWRVVCAWIGDDLCGDGDLPTTSHASYKVIIESFLNCCCNSVLGKSDSQTEPVVKQMFLIATASFKEDLESHDHTNGMQSITMSHGGLLKLYLWCSEEFTTDWSIGWMEPHAPDFYQSDDEQDVNDASFAVLVPCYRNDCKAFKMDDHPANNHFLNVMANGNFPPEGNKYMEQWIASLQNF
ncbi:hypothetical protein Tco_0265195 [Tanacetum coccineum]